MTGILLCDSVFVKLIIAGGGALLGISSPVSLRLQPGSCSVQLSSQFWVCRPQSCPGSLTEQYFPGNVSVLSVSSVCLSTCIYWVDSPAPSSSRPSSAGAGSRAWRSAACSTWRWWSSRCSPTSPGSSGSPRSSPASLQGSLYLSFTSTVVRSSLGKGCLPNILTETDPVPI